MQSAVSPGRAMCVRTPRHEAEKRGSGRGTPLARCRAACSARRRESPCRALARSGTGGTHGHARIPASRRRCRMNGTMGKLSMLSQEADGLLSRLVRLRQTLAQMRDDLHGTGPGNMLAEANEQLILAALHAEEVAETAVSKLGELTRSSQHDPLTGLPNRVLMRDRLENAIALAQRHGTRLALLFVDLDDFKRINDTLGHAAGDEALKLVALRMRAVLRNSDTVSRHGGE